MWCLHPAKMNSEKLIFAELLRRKLHHINHIQMSFVQTNAIKTTARVGVVYPPSKTNNTEKMIFAELLRCILDCINHIHISFVHTNAIETLARVGIASPPIKNK